VCVCVCVCVWVFVCVCVCVCVCIKRERGGRRGGGEYVALDYAYLALDCE
jgi:hypothetical protein